MRLVETASPSTLTSVIIFLTTLDALAIGLRLYTRYSLGQKFKSDDWFASIAFLLVLGLAVYLSIGIRNHWVGYPLPPDFTGEVYYPLVSNSLQHFYIWCLLLFPALWLIKCSFILFYRRVFVIDKQDYKDWTNLTLLLALVFITIWTIAFGFAWAFSCTPVRGFWSFPYESDQGPCVDTWTLHQSITISDFIIDVLIIILPIPMVWRLHLPIGRKLAVLMVFFLGAIAIAASIMRMVRVVWAAGAEEDGDGLLVNSTVLFWAMIEANLGLLAACLPTLRGALKARAIDNFIKGFRSRRSLRSKSSHTLPLTNSKSSSQERRSNDRRKMFLGDVTLTTLDSVATITPMTEAHTR